MSSVGGCTPIEGSSLNSLRRVRSPVKTVVLNLVMNGAWVVE